MKVTMWGTRGSLATPGPATARYGGNTSCVEVSSDDTVLVLDAGTGIRPLGKSLKGRYKRVDLLLTHLHMDHIQGLGFFEPLFEEGMEIHIWGPPSTTQSLHARLTRYLSPPLFPVHLRDVPSRLALHDVPGDFTVGPFRIRADLVLHPGPTVGYRIQAAKQAIAYIPDHEPALGMADGFTSPEWTSGYELARGVDLLLHDSQYTHEEYESRTGWGHSTTAHMIAFAKMARVGHLVPFHHDPDHTDADIDAMYADMQRLQGLPFAVTPGAEGHTFEV
jgi:phosphoribosyl 1,2-cyclic phosphodiesterase